MTYDRPMRGTAFLRFGVVAVLVTLPVTSGEWLGARAMAIAPRDPTTTALPQPPATEAPAGGQLPADEKVSFCHRTNSIVNPYILVTTSVEAIRVQAHSGHTGPVFPAPDWGDIIPPFDYDNGQQQFPGLNWPSGSDVLVAGCAVRQTIDPILPTPTTAPPTTTSTTAPATTTTTTTPGVIAPPDQPTTSPLPASTTTPGGSGSGGTTTTTVPSPTGTTPPTAAPLPLDPPPVSALAPGEALSDPLPRVVAFVIVPGNNLVILGELSPDQVHTLFRELGERRLADTGDDTGPTAIIALLSLVSGCVLVGMAARRRRRYP